MNMPQNIPFGALARPLDPITYRTNAIIMGLTVLLGVLNGARVLLATGDFGAAVVAGFFMGATTFLSWGITREIDPKYPYSAFVSVAVAVVVMLIAPANLELFALAALLTGVRIVNRIVGVPTQVGDSGVVLILFGLVSFLGHWVVAVAGVVMFILDARLVNGVRWQWGFAFLAGILAGIGFATRAGEMVAPSLPVLVGLVVVSAGFIWAIAATKDVGETDLAGYVLYPRRVQAGMAVILLGAWLPALWLGDVGVWSLSTLWAVFVGVTVHRVLMIVRKG